MKRLIHLLSLLLFLLVPITASANIHRSSASVDWNTGFIQAVGVGAPPASVYPTPEATEAAKKSAITDANKVLAETVKDIRLDGRTVGDLARQDDVVNLKLSAFIRNASLVRERKLTDNYYEVVIQLPLYGTAGLEGIVPQLRSFAPQQSSKAEAAVRTQGSINSAPTPAPAAEPANQPLLVITQPAIEKFQWLTRKDGYDRFQLQLSLPEPKDVAWIELLPSEDSSGASLDSYNYLEVYYKDVRIRHSMNESLGVFSGAAAIELRASHRDEWKPGHAFLVEVVFSDGSRLIQLARLGSMSPGAAAPSANLPVPYRITSFAYTGSEADRVGAGLKGMPDGTKDHVFRLSLALPPSTEISKISLFTTNEKGRISSSPYIWDSKDVKRWVLGVVHKGKQLNYNHIDSLGVYSTQAEFEIYANKQSNYSKYFLVEVSFADGSRNGALVKVENFD